MKSLPWRPILVAALSAFAAARIIVITREGLSNFHRETDIHCRDDTDYNIEGGEALFHGLPLPREQISWSMPAYSLANALACHARGGRELVLPASTLWLNGSVVFAIGRLLSGTLGGAGAAALFAATLNSDDAFNERWAYVLAVLLVGLAAVWRARRPSAASSAWLGASVGASFLFLSSLILYPFAAEIVAWAGQRRREGLRVWAKSALALLIPLVFLAPWTAMNWRLRHEVIVLERARSDTNVITGAAGLVKTVGAEDPRILTGFSGNKSPLSWAVLEVLRHPGRFARACLARAAFVVDIHPMLFSLAIIGFLWRRRQPETAALALVAACYFGAHCLMPVERRYFAPFWPLAAALAVAIVPNPGLRDSDVESARLSCVAPALPAMLLIAPFILWVWTLCLVYPGRSSAPAALERELADRPSEAWLWAYSGDSLLRAGRAREAEAALERSLSLQSQSDIAYRLALARAVAGKNPGTPVSSNDNEYQIHWSVLTGLWNLGRGQMEAARRDFADAVQRQDGRRMSRAGGGENAAISACSSEAARISLEKEILDKIRLWPFSEQLRILRGLMDLGRVGDEVLIDSEHLLAMAIAYQNNGDYGKALAVLDGPLGSQRTPRWHNDRGVTLACLHRVPEAMREFEAAIAGDADLLTSYLSLGILLDRAGRRPEALHAYEIALGRPLSSGRENIKPQIIQERDRLRRRVD